MKKLLSVLTTLAVVVLPMMAIALQPPGGGSGSVGSSPEPIAGALLLAGSIPTYLIYRRSRRSDS